MVLSKEKILTVRAIDYAKSHQGASLSNYNMVGVHGQSLEALCKQAPENTEAIVDLKTSDYLLGGTALVRKKE